MTGQTYASFEPALDYVVVKIPRWPFDKFAAADRRLGTQMKATGEVMAIDRTFEAALQKAVRSLESGVGGLAIRPVRRRRRRANCGAFLQPAGDERLFAVIEARAAGDAGRRKSTP